MFDENCPKMAATTKFGAGKTTTCRALAAFYLASLEQTANAGIIHGNLASLYYKRGLLDLAIVTYREAIKLEPNFPDAYCNLGNALKEKGEMAEAEKCYDKALELSPEHADALNNLGNLKREQGKPEVAIQMYKRALEMMPRFAAVHNNLASLLQQQGNLKEALHHYEQAVSLKPEFADAYSNMGNVLRELHDLQGAMTYFKKAVEINPRFADAHCNLASIYKDMSEISNAISSYKLALNIQPNFPDAFCNLAYCLQCVCSWDNYDERMRAIVSITEDQLLSNNKCSVHPHHSILYPLSSEMRKGIAARYANIYLEKSLRSSKPMFNRSKKLKGRLRIGYVSSDFGDHPTSHLMQSVPGMHDRTTVKIFCYTLSKDDGTTFRSKIQNESENFVDLSRYEKCKDIAKKINSDKINILINMNGYTKGSKTEIFAIRSAPIQVMWLGYPNTSGAPYMDYFITDEVSSPKSTSMDFSEKLAFMPHTHFIGDHKQMFPHLVQRYIIRVNNKNTLNENVAVINAGNNVDMMTLFNVNCYNEVISYENLESIRVTVREINIPIGVIEMTTNYMHRQVYINNVKVQNGISLSSVNGEIATGQKIYDNIIFTSRKQYGLPEDAIVFCNFNQLYKMDPVVMTLWVKILKRVPKSVLWLLKFPSSGQPYIEAFVKDLGLPPNRLIFSDVACKEEHVRRGQLADVCLDTILCNGHTTTMDVLWTGTPVVTLPGQTLASRIAASQILTLNCPELVANDIENYEEIAVRLGTDHQYRKYERAKVARARFTSTLFSCQYFVTELEKLYAKMWELYANGLEPDHIQTY